MTTTTGDAELVLLIDHRTPAPPSHRIATALRAAIDAGAWPLHLALPTETALARRLRVSRPTVHTAMLALLADGVVARGPAAAPGGRQGSGWWVVGRDARSPSPDRPSVP